MERMSSLESRINGCLWGLAAGNVVGLSAESLPREVACQVLGASGDLKRLPTEEMEDVWDDDLAMAMVLAKWLCDGGEDPAFLLKDYRRWFQKNGRGAGRLTSEVLDRPEGEWAETAREVWDELRSYGLPPQGNGSLMRVAPIGLNPANPPARIRDLALLDASLTHWDPICGEAAAFLALLVNALIREESEPIEWARAALECPLSPELEKALQPTSLEALAVRRVDGQDMGHVLVTLKTAVSVLRSGLSYQEGVLWTLRQGGDTDTNGAVVGAILGARDGIDAIPHSWIGCVPKPNDLNAILRRVRGSVC